MYHPFHSIVAVEAVKNWVGNNLTETQSQVGTKPAFSLLVARMLSAQILPRPYIVSTMIVTYPF